MIDTHTHIYLPEFSDDVQEVLASARQSGLSACWLPGIDAGSLSQMESLKQVCGDFVELFAGLHPTEVREDWREQLELIRPSLDNPIYKGVGEIGLDLYWDKTFQKEQEDALCAQLDWAAALEKPVLLHVRNAYDEMMELMKPYWGRLRGVFHCFSGTREQALTIVGNGFLLGVGGSITYKNSQQAAFLREIPLESIVTETDAPYLSPIPKRGTRNQPSFMAYTADFLSNLYGVSLEELSFQTEINAKRLLK